MAKTIDAELVFSQLPRRKADSNKGSYGKLVLVCGSSHYRGAAALSAEGALRMGAGLVTLATTEPVAAGVAARLPECTFLPCRQTAEGGISSQSGKTILQRVHGANALLFGPGMGDTEDTLALLELLGPGAGCPLVLDADGLNAASKLDKLPRMEDFPLVLTPHPGEMARLCGLTIAEINAGREGIAASYARAQNCVLVLKGNRTIVAGPQGEVYTNPTGNPGLAKAGSGDVLAGMIAALIAQGLSPLMAAVCGVWLHGAAADLCAQRKGQYSMLAHELLDDLGIILAQNER